MFNPPLYQNSGSDPDLVKRMTQRLQAAGVDKQLLEIFRQSFERELAKENIVGISRPERMRLFRLVAQAILTDRLGKMDDTK